MDTTAELLVSQLEVLSSSKSASPTTNIAVPTLQQFYQLGLVLYNVTAARSGDQSKLQKDLLVAYDHLINVLPDAALIRICSGLNTTTDVLLRSPDVGVATQDDDDDDNNNNDGDLVRTCQALAGLWVHSPRLCRLAYTTQWISTLASLYDRMMMSMMAGKTTQGITTTTTSRSTPQDAVLSSISCLLLDGLLDQKHSFQSLSLEVESENGESDSLEERLLEAIQAMEGQSLDCLRDVQQWQSQQEGPVRTLELAAQNINSSNTDNDDTLQQREYILNMLESARQSSSEPSALSRSTPKNKEGTTTTRTTSTAKSVAVDELERRIQQVKQILPHLGEGFIETALSLNQGEVEATMSMLLMDTSQYPVTLQVMDPSLPRRRRETTTVEEAASSAEARQVVKERVALEQQKEAERYQALLYVSQQQKLEEQRQKEQDQQEDGDVDMYFNVCKNEQFEYDDDYDDQYDEMDIRLGGADDGFTWDGDDDFEKIKMYNQIAREGEAEDSFWEANRNTNRAAVAGKKNGGDDDDERQYRGSDKIKGGRVIGPDGKIVRNPGGAGGKQNKRRNNNTNNNSTNNPDQQQGTQNANGNGKNAGRGGGGGDGSSSNGSNAQTNGNGSSNNKRTKPKSNNRLNRQRDNKQKKQGAFGVQG